LNTRQQILYTSLFLETGLTMCAVIPMNESV
jgi:hypothetical protein